MKLSTEIEEAIANAISYSIVNEYEYVTPETLLIVLLEENSTFSDLIDICHADNRALKTSLASYLRENMENSLTEDLPKLSNALENAFFMAEQYAESSAKKEIELSHVIKGIWELEQSYAVFYMKQQGLSCLDMLRALQHYLDVHRMMSNWDSTGSLDSEINSNEDMLFCSDYGNDYDSDFDFDIGDEYGDDYEGAYEFGNRKGGKTSGKPWKRFVTCLNSELSDVNPLIGREYELERTIQILCRKDKNNPFHIGEAGVGKTAITYGLVQLIKEDKVPDSLKGAQIYALDMGTLVSGSQYRGDFEKKLKMVLEGLRQEEKPIVYIDEIHTLVGAGAASDSSLDASNMLKPYLAEGKIRFIGATTYQEYKKHFEKSKSLVRRFQNVEIKEPTKEECIQILEGLKSKYEKFHGVKYAKGVIEHAVFMSDKYINERFLPDKAIDLIDEAGAYRKLHPTDKKTQTINKTLINDVLTKICHVQVEAVESEKDDLKTLENRILSMVYGQDEAVRQVVNAVKFSKAGLIEDNKPLASLLFVGPTGVGKTEVAKRLAMELGVKLIRFDMSEYGEKHSIAKLIGSPAGYVGYEEGGLLTEEIRKNPSAVLLLDEIEKAHPDIFHIMLQVMDYATLTDNQGRKADFRNIIIIMTSNAGAKESGKTGLGFGENNHTSNAIMEEVKRVFQPEFRNRLTRTVVFNAMDNEMSKRVVAKKLSELSKLLLAKGVYFTYSDAAAAAVLEKGISREYGAREIDRVISGSIKPLLVDDILFGKLKKGGKCQLDYADGNFTVRVKR